MSFGEADLASVDVQPVGADAAVVADTSVALHSTPPRKAPEGARDLAVEDVHRRLVAGLRGGEFSAHRGEPILVGDLGAHLVDLDLIHGSDPTAGEGNEGEDDEQDSGHRFS